ncbi:hypothetical protein ACJX0J_027557, partial [Zea mays]
NMTNDSSTVSDEESLTAIEDKWDFEIKPLIVLSLYLDEIQARNNLAFTMFDKHFEIAHMIHVDLFNHLTPHVAGSRETFRARNQGL